MIVTENLYLIQLYNDRESFFKIGTTVHKYSRFYQLGKFGYKVRIVFMALGLDPYIAWDMERHLQDLWESYLPKIKFGGYTECFEYVDLTVFKKKIIDRIGENFKNIENLEITWR